MVMQVRVPGKSLISTFYTPLEKQHTIFYRLVMYNRGYYNFHIENIENGVANNRDIYTEITGKIAICLFQCSTMSRAQLAKSDPYMWRPPGGCRIKGLATPD